MKLIFALCAVFLVVQAAVVEPPKVTFQDAQVLAELPSDFAEYDFEDYEIAEYGTSWCLIVSLSLFLYILSVFKSLCQIPAETQLETQKNRNQRIRTMERPCRRSYWHNLRLSQTRTQVSTIEKGQRNYLG